MLLLFQVRLTGDCKQISHKDFNCLAERQTSLSSLIKAKLSFMPSVRFTSLQMRFILIWRLLVEFLIITGLNFFYCFIVTVVSILFYPQ